MRVSCIDGTSVGGTETVDAGRAGNRAPVVPQERLGARFDAARLLARCRPRAAGTFFLLLWGMGRQGRGAPGRRDAQGYGKRTAAALDTWSLEARGSLALANDNNSSCPIYPGRAGARSDPDPGRLGFPALALLAIQILSSSVAILFFVFSHNSHSCSCQKIFVRVFIIINLSFFYKL